MVADKAPVVHTAGRAEVILAGARAVLEMAQGA